MDTLDIEDKRLDLRRKQWEALCEKYTIRGEINTADCRFSEVNYKMFIKSTPKTKFKVRQNKAQKKEKMINNRNIDVANNNKYKTEKSPDNTVSSTISFISNGLLTSFGSNNQSGVNVQENVNLYETESIDSGLGMDDKEFCGIGTSSNSCINIDEKYTSLTEMCNLKHQNNSIDVHSTGDDHLHTLISYIEKELKSNLKVILKKRSVSKLLELDEYSYWHKCTKEEMTKLRQYVSKDDLKEYMRHCYSGDISENNMRVIEDAIVLKLKSNLHSLFFKREHSRHDKTRYLKYHSRVILEWRRLCKVVPVDYLLLYGTTILKLFKEKEE